IPPLVGQIIAGFLLGPPLADFVPFPEAMVLLGDLGLILLLVEAGIELDVGLVREAGIRPVLIAIAGSILPFSIGLGVALAQGKSIKSGIACGASFSPTSLGVAANALSGGSALNTPVGQLIVASAVIDDMIGLIILSMMEVLVAEEPALYEYFIPIVSWFAAQFVVHCILPLFKVENRPAVAFTLLWALLMAYLPMMYYSRASYLTGAFLAGLSFGQVEGVHHTFVQEAGVIMDWLLRIFFAASIGFQVPIKMFGSSHVVAWGFAFYTAVLGKLPVGLFAPKYDEETPKDYPFNPYVRDVVITSVAMTCRGEFSFIIAAFGIGEGLLDPELYSSIIFAVLLSSITSPIMLTVILKYY
ncbi:Na+/H+ exchanger, partial [Thalassiosira pseudonana CCMP1335]